MKKKAVQLRRQLIFSKVHLNFIQLLGRNIRCGKEIKIWEIFISKKFKEVLVYSYATHTLNYSSVFLIYVVGIRISNVSNQSKATGEKKESETLEQERWEQRRPYRAWLLLFYQFDLINDTTSHTSFASFASLGQHTYNTPAFKKRCGEWLTGCSQASVESISPICHPSQGLVIETPAAAWAGRQQIPVGS